MSENYHYVQLTIEQGELHRNFVCTAPDDADCRRRPPEIELTGQESWTKEQATVPGYPCWAREWVEAVGIEDAIIGGADQVLAAVPVTINYADGVEIEPTGDAWGLLPKATDGSHMGHRIAEHPTLTGKDVPRFCHTCEVEIEPRVRGA